MSDPTPALPPLKAKAGFLNMPKLPVAGFFARLLAFVLDLILIVAGIHLVSKYLEEAIYSIPLWAPYLTTGFMFFYFVLLNGPYGRGQTIGKMALRIRVRDYDGQTISWRQAVLRTVFMFPVFVTVPITQAVLGDGRGIWQDFVSSLLTNNLLLGIVVANLLIIPFNPFRQGIHDDLAETIVAGAAPADAVTFSDLISQIGPGWRQFHRQPQYSGYVTLGLVMLLQGVMMNPYNFDATQRTLIDGIYQLSQNKGFHDSEPSYVPVEETLYQQSLAAQDNPLGSEQAPSFEDESTTGVLKLVLQVTRPQGWSLNLESAPDRELGMAYLNDYHTTVMPALLRYVEGSGDEGAKKRVSEWYGRPVQYRLLLVQRVSLKPYPPIFREQANGLFEFGPLSEPDAGSLGDN